MSDRIGGGVMSDRPDALLDALVATRRARPLIFDAMTEESPGEDRRLCEQAMHLVDAALDALSRVALSKMTVGRRGRPLGDSWWSNWHETPDQHSEKPNG